MKSFTFLIGILGLFVFSGSAYAEMVQTSAALDMFSGPVLFQDLEEMAPHAAFACSIFAWGIFMVAIVGKMQRGEFENNPLLTISKVIMAMGCMAFSTHVFDMALTVSEDVAETLNAKPQGSLANKVFNIFHTLEAAQGAHEQKVQPNAPAEVKPAEATALDFIKNPVGTIYEGVSSYFSRLIVFTVVAIISGFLWVCSWIITIVETARYFLVQICSLLCPVFIAGLLTESFSSQAYSFIFNVIGLLLWPVGWAIGHLGTQSLFAAASKIMMVNAIKVDAAAAETAEAMQESIANGTYEPGASIDGISSLSSLGMGPLLCFVMIMGVTCIWILAVTFKAPHFIQQLVTSGGAGFSSMLSGMGVVGQVAGGVAAQATGASILARGAQAIPEKMGQAVVGGTSAVARSAAVGAGKGAAYVARSAASGIGTALAPVRGSLEASLQRYRAIQARIDAKSPK